MGKTWARHETTETISNNGWRLVAVGGWRTLSGAFERCSMQPDRRGPGGPFHLPGGGGGALVRRDGPGRHPAVPRGPVL